VKDGSILRFTNDQIRNDWPSVERKIAETIRDRYLALKVKAYQRQHTA
jgi:hypothetical protein